MIRTGIREIGRRMNLLYTWHGLSLVFAIVIVAPLAIAIAAALGQSLETSRLFQDFDMSWIAEFGYSAHWEQLTVWLPLFGMIGAAFVLLTTWLSGGLLTVLRDPDQSFFAGCGRWFPPFLRLFLFAVIGYAIAFGIRSGFGALVRKLSDDSMSGKPSAYGAMAGLVVFWAAISLVNMIVDYSKIHMVAYGERKARRGIISGIRFVFRNFRRCANVYLALTGYMLLMMAVYHVWSEVIGQASIGAVLLLFVVRQIYMFGRTWLRMVFLASQYAFFASLRPKPPMLEPLQESLEFNESY